MENSVNLHEGALLEKLIKHTPFTKGQVAKGLAIEQTSLSRLFKTEKLSSKVKRATNDFFGMDEAFWATGEIGEISIGAEGSKLLRAGLGSDAGAGRAIVVAEDAAYWRARAEKLERERDEMWERVLVLLDKLGEKR